MKKLLLTLFILIALGALLYQGKHLLQKRQAQIAQSPTAQTQSIKIATATPKIQTLQSAHTFQAQVKALHSVTIASKIPARVVKTHVQELQTVRKDQLLVTLDDLDVHAQIASLQSTLQAQLQEIAHAKKVYTSSLEVYRAGGLAKEKLEASRIAYKLKKAQADVTRSKLKQAKAQLDYLKIRAPFEGIVEQVLAKGGDFAGAGKPLVRLSNGEKELIVSYSKHARSIVRPGAKVRYNREIIGVIDHLYMRTTGGLYTAKVRLNKQIQEPFGAHITLEVLAPEQSGCLLPSTAIRREDSRTLVARYDETQRRFILEETEVIAHSDEGVLVRHCPKGEVALGSEETIDRILSMENITLKGQNDE